MLLVVLQFVGALKMLNWKQLHSFKDFENFMGDKNWKKIYSYLAFGYDCLEDCYYVKYHNTRIVTFYRNGNVTINNGGYLTKTTKKYINMFAYDYIYIKQKKCVWYGFINTDKIEKDGIKLIVGDDITCTQSI